MKILQNRNNTILLLPILLLIILQSFFLNITIKALPLTNIQKYNYDNNNNKIESLKLELERLASQQEAAGRRIPPRVPRPPLRNQPPHFFRASPPPPPPHSPVSPLPRPPPPPYYCSLASAFHPTQLL